MIYDLIEYAAALIENMLILWTITKICTERLGPGRQGPMLVACALLETLLLAGLGQFLSFSLIWIAVCIAMDAAVSKALCKGDLTERLIGDVFAVFVLHSLDYILCFSVAIILDRFSVGYSGFAAVMHSGPIRAAYLIVSRMLTVGVVFLLREHIPRLSAYKQHRMILLASLLIVYALISILVKMITSESSLAIQSAIVISWICILVGVVSLILLLYRTIQYQSEKATGEAMRKLNQSMQKSYALMSENLKARSKQTHDFKNHLRVIRSFADNEAKVKEYINSLTDSLGRVPALCKSGDEYIDAILNSTVEEARLGHIPFSYSAQVSEKTGIEPADLCAILANLLDNALEASRNIENVSERHVQVKIEQKQGYTLFVVENNTAPDAVMPERLGSTSKEDPRHEHGYGLANIRDAAARYGGSFTYEISRSKFSATVMIPCASGKKEK